MRGCVWVSTYRRPESLQRCLAAMVGKGLSVIVVMPRDETHSIPSACLEITVPDESAHAGPGAVRRWILQQAEMVGHDFVVFADDDVFIKDESDLNVIAQDFEENSNLGAVNCGGRLKEGRPTYPIYWLGAMFAVRVSTAVEVGGVDLDMPTNEDTDLAIRILLAGYEIVRDRRVRYFHQMHKDGGLAAFDGTDGKGKAAIKGARMGSRVKMLERMIAKYPPGVVYRSDRPGLVAHAVSRLEIQKVVEMYRKGEVTIDVNGVSPRYWE